MTSLLELLLYIPITLVILLVLEVCKSNDVRRIVQRTLVNFGTLTLILIVGSVVIHFINRYL